MERKYTFNLTTVNKYCYNGIIWSPPKEIIEIERDGTIKKEYIIEQEIRSELYHVRYKTYLENLIQQFPKLEPHIGNLFRIMEYFMEDEQYANQSSILADELREPIKRMYFLQEIVENPKTNFQNLEVIVNRKSDNPLHSDFMINEGQLNKILIERILRDFKTYFNEIYQGMYSDLFNHDTLLKEISHKELERATGILEHEGFNLKIHTATVTKDTIEITLNDISSQELKKLVKELELNRFNLITEVLTSEMFKIVVKDITSEELARVIKRLDTKTNKINDVKINLEKEIIRALLNYLNNETELNPKRDKMNKTLANIIYKILFIFNATTAPHIRRNETEITKHIRIMNRHKAKTI